MEDGRVSPPVVAIRSDESDESSPESQIQHMRPGRLSIKCIRATDIRRRGQIHEGTIVLNPCLRFTLGPTSSKPLQSTSRTQHETNESPSFQDEILSFDVQNPNDYISNGNDVRLKIELLNENLLRFDTLGEIEMSAVRFFSSTESRQEHLPLKLAGAKSSEASISLEFVFMPVTEGLLSISLIECNNLLRLDSNEMQIAFGLGTDSKKSKSVKDKFGQEQIYLEVHQRNWFNTLAVKLNAINDSGTKVIGEQNLPLLPLISDQHDDEPCALPLLAIKDGEEIQAGNVVMALKFLQAGRLTVKDIRGSSFDRSNTLMNAGLQLVFETKGRASTVEERSSILRYEFPGKEVIWNDELRLPVVDHHLLRVEFYCLDALGTSKDLVGSGEISLLPLYKDGRLSTTVKLQGSNEVGVVTERGEISFTLNFDGHGLAYPMLHVSPMVAGQEDLTPKAPLAQEVVRKSKAGAASVSEVFSDDDIKSAFHFLDLDKNGYIGAAELRHALICMGELVTDEEVDAMIEILDMSGDGQVNFQQFAMMGKSPNFGYENISNMQFKEKDRAIDEDYDVKRLVFSRFVFNNKIHRATINTFREYLGQKRNAKLSSVDDESSNNIWKIDYASLCRSLTVERTAESRKVFDILKPDEADMIDTRQLVLGLVNFIPTYSVYERCQMMLELYDEHKLDTLTFEDLKEALAGNHLKSTRAVEKKADTIMKFVDHAGTGKLTQEGLLDAASKFPNLIFPKHVLNDSV